MAAKTKPRYCSEVTLKNIFDLVIAEWGACGGDLWRLIVEEVLEKRGVDLQTVLNPDDPNWTPDNASTEEACKRFVTAHIVYIGSQTRATVSISELVALMLQGAYTVPVIDDIDPELVIKGQSVGDAGAKVLNQMREFTRQLATVLGVVVYPDVVTAAGSMKLDQRDHVRRTLTAIQKSKIKDLMKIWGYGTWTTDHQIVVSSEPYKAQIDILMALCAAMSREGRKDYLEIYLPDVSKWSDVITGRECQDLQRTIAPYFFDLLKKASISVDVILQ